VAVPGHLKGVEAVAWLVKWIVDHDTHRGFNPADFIVKESIRTQKARDDASHERNEAAADALHFGLMRDVGHLHDGITRRLHAVPTGPATSDTTTRDTALSPAPAPAPVPERTATP
jgi:hypothetical protein